MSKSSESRRQFLGVSAGASALAALGVKKSYAQTEPPGTISAEMVKQDKAKVMQWH